MKRPASLLSRMLLCAACTFFLQTALAQDLIVDGIETAPGGTYGHILVKNGGTLTIDDDVTARLIHLQWGTLTIHGSVTVTDSLVVVADTAGVLTVEGNRNDVRRVSVWGGTLNLYGRWTSDAWVIGAGATVQVIPYDTALPETGTLMLDVRRLEIAVGGHLRADGAGGDERGIGCGWYRCSGGGGYGGTGGRGFWGASNAGDPYGADYTYEIAMGSRGSSTGGGSIALFANEALVVNGTISADGLDGSSSGSGRGAGSGGGLFIRTPSPMVTGTLSANGGTGGVSLGGGGGGGRIKVFYERDLDVVQLLPLTSVRGGDGYYPSNDGTIFYNAVPQPPALLLPADGAALSDGTPTFTFNLLDESLTADGRVENLSGMIELSLDGFETVFRTYEQDQSLAGWSSLLYTSGDVASFTPDEPLPDAVFAWRAYVRDRSLYSAPSAQGTFTVGAGFAVPHLSAPADAAENVPPTATLAWTPVPGAQQYQLQLSTEADLSTFVADTVVVATDFAPPGLDYQATYYWRVRPLGASGTGPWSPLYRFGTAALAPPTLLTPADDEENLPTTLTLAWEIVVGASLYHVQLATDEAFTTVLLDTTGIVATSLPLSLLAHETQFFWRVRAANATDVGGPWSAARRFTTATVTGLEDTMDDLPAQYSLAPGYPNPFAASVRISYTLPAASAVRLTVFDVLGREAGVLVDAVQAPGRYAVTWHAPDLPSGLLFYRLEAGPYVATRPMVKVRQQ